MGFNFRKALAAPQRSSMMPPRRRLAVITAGACYFWAWVQAWGQQ